MEYLELYLWFIKERHSIYQKRFSGVEWPWTDDEILQKYKFTNIYRELDAGTVYCRDSIRAPLANSQHLFFNIAAYRRYNLIETHQLLGNFVDYPREMKTWLPKLLKRREKGLKIFTGAHMLCGNIAGDDGVVPPTKVEQVFGISLIKLWERREELAPRPDDTLESAFNRLQKANIPGFGDFINYEVITDLRHTRYLKSAPDKMTWANPGPGCKRGACWLLGIDFGNNADGKWVDPPSNLDYLQTMRELLGVVNLQRFMPVMELRDIEHSLCEFDKYMRVLYGRGRPRSTYIPPHLR